MQKFRTVRTIVDEDKVVSAEINEDLQSGRHSFILLRSYEGADGVVKQSRYFRVEHGAAIRRVLILAERALEELEAERFAQTRRPRSPV